MEKMWTGMGNNAASMRNIIIEKIVTSDPVLYMINTKVLYVVKGYSFILLHIK